VLSPPGTSGMLRKLHAPRHVPRYVITATNGALTRIMFPGYTVRRAATYRITGY